METIIETVDENNIEVCSAVFELAGRIIRRGGLVAFPTETVYGLGADAMNPAAVRKIYEAKGRPSDNPLIVHVADRSMVDALTSEINDAAELLMEKFFPGSLTVIMKKNKKIPDCVTGGLDTVGIRCPKSCAARAFLKAAGVGVAAPSANISGKPSPTRAEHVINDMNGRVDMIIDGGDSEVGLESTVIDTTSVPPTVLRPGRVTLEDIRVFIPEAVYDSALFENREVEKPKSPGMKYKHYSPEAEVFVVEGGREAVSDKIKSLIKNDCKTAVISLHNESYPVFKVFNIENTTRAFARELFNILRECDKLGVQEVYAEMTSCDGLGFAVQNRLYKAAGYKIIRV